MNVKRNSFIATLNCLLIADKCLDYWYLYQLCDMSTDPQKAPCYFTGLWIRKRRDVLSSVGEIIVYSNVFIDLNWGNVNDIWLFQTHSDHNRTMLFQVGRIDLRLISPDRKQILLHKHLRDVASCIQVLMDWRIWPVICT
jgi:hypothetical protein